MSDINAIPSEFDVFYKIFVVNQRYASCCPPVYTRA